MRFRLTLFLAVLVLTVVPTMVQAVSVAPGVLEVSGERGAVIEDTFQLINTKEREKTYHFRTIGVDGASEDGVPRFVTDQSSGLSKWIEFETDSLRVPPHSVTDVPFSVYVPADVPSGSYAAGMLASPSPADVVQTNGAIIEANAAVILLLTVEGDTVLHIELLDATSTYDDGIHDSIDGKTDIRVQNQGNVFMAPTGQLTLTDLFGRTVAQVPFNPDMHRVLPGTTRTFSLKAGAEPTHFLAAIRQQAHLMTIGPVEATLSIDGGSDGREITQGWTFWYLPWQLLTVTLIGIALLSLILIHAFKRTPST